MSKKYIYPMLFSHSLVFSDMNRRMDHKKHIHFHMATYLPQPNIFAPANNGCQNIPLSSLIYLHTHAHILLLNILILVFGRYNQIAFQKTILIYALFNCILFFPISLSTLDIIKPLNIVRLVGKNILWGFF